MTRKSLLLWTLLLATPLFAQTPPSIVPSTGSTVGGEVVLIHGDFGTGPPTVRFGLEEAVSAERIDADTIRVVTPPHLPGKVSVFLFDYDMWVDTGLDFTFTGGVPLAAYERVLLPIFTPPVRGAHGSEFYSEFRVKNGSGSSLSLYELAGTCPVQCTTLIQQLGPGEEVHPEMLWRTGTPGQFLYLPKSQSDQTIMQLRVYDVSRWDTNFGTEIPVVRGDEMRSEPVVLLGVPQTSSFFRNTLRIYATYATTFSVLIEGVDGYSQEHFVTLQPGADVFHPAYGVFTDFPDALGPFRVTVSVVAPQSLTPLPPPPDFWAFVSVTNNDTQHITLISPQR